MSIKIEFPAGDTRAAELFGSALLQYAGKADGCYVPATGGPSEPVEVDTPTAAEQTEQEQRQDARDNPIDQQTDTKGVPFNGDYCGVSKDPFYASGPRAGQWKKRRSTAISEEAYDEWYAGELAKLQGADTDEQPPVNTAGAFAGASAGGDTAPPPPPPVADNTPADVGTLLKWFAENKTAGRLQDNDLTEAYEAVGITFADMLPPTAPEQLKANIAKVVHFLVSRGAEAPQ